MDTMNTLIGRGMKFPFEPTRFKGVSREQSLARINQSLLILLDTPKGSRLMLPEFGSDIHKYRFEPFDDILIERIRYTVTEDIKKWEPRIELVNMHFRDDHIARESQILYITINYRIINTGVLGNFVYPYRKDTYSLSEE